MSVLIFRSVKCVKVLWCCCSFVGIGKNSGFVTLLVGGVFVFGYNALGYRFVLHTYLCFFVLEWGWKVVLSINFVTYWVMGPGLMGLGQVLLLIMVGVWMGCVLVGMVRLNLLGCMGVRVRVVSSHMLFWFWCNEPEGV